MNDALGVAILVVVSVLLWDRITSKRQSSPLVNGKGSTLSEMIAEKLEAEVL